MLVDDRIVRITPRSRLLLLVVPGVGLKTWLLLLGPGELLGREVDDGSALSALTGMRILLEEVVMLTMPESGIALAPLLLPTPLEKS